MLSDPSKATTGGSGGMKELSCPGRVYVLAVIAVGGGLILSSIIQLALETTTPYWVIVAALALFSAPLAIRVPSMRATVTVTETFVFAAALLCCSCVVWLVPNLDNLTVAAVGVFVPLLVLSYASSRLSAARVEATNGHLNELRQLYLSTIEALALAIDAKDQVTSGHIRRVQRHSVVLARELGIADAHQINAIEAAALLHDLGKLAMPEHILNKPGKLTPVEFEQMKTHATIGADILATIDFPYPVEPIVRHHHEMWDGKGYPEGIRGEDIPIGARILAVVDCFDALTSDRPYRRALTPDQATAVLVHRRGTQYDPRVIDAFIAVRDRLIDAVALSARSGAESGRQADIREMVAPRLLLGEVELPEPSAGLDEGAGLDHRVCTPRVDDEGCMLPTFRVISRYLETVAPGAVCVLYSHEVDQARLVFSHTSSVHHEFLLRDVSMPLGDRLTGWVGANRRTILNSDPALELGNLAAAWHPCLHTCIAMPLIVGDILLGVLSVYSPDQQGFSHRQAQTLALLASEGLEQLSDDSAPAPAHRPRPLPVRRPRIVPVPA